jgi:hypothetical protein
VDALAGERIALLTQHGKEGVIAPRFRAAFDARVERVAGFDTDRLGTFTRDVARAGSQLDAARTKARLGMQLSGLPRGLASEGAFGPDPMAGLIPWDVELLIYVDDVRQIEVAAWVSAAARHHHGTVESVDDLERFAARAGFPDHQLVVRPGDAHDARVRKGLATHDDLHEAYRWARALSGGGAVFVESDLRAHANPTRMRTIAAATDQLVARLRSPCPTCGTPGFWLAERIPGLPCAACGAPTRQPKADRYACLQCLCIEVRSAPAATHASPAHCDLCNP